MENKLCDNRMPELNMAFVGVCACDCILVLTRLDSVNAARFWLNFYSKKLF